MLFEIQKNIKDGYHRLIKMGGKIIYLAITIFVFSSFVNAQICEAPSGYDCWYVSTSGSDSNVGSFNQPFRTVQYAINHMSGGDYIYLRSGTYREGHIKIDPGAKDGTCGNPEDCFIFHGYKNHNS